MTELPRPFHQARALADRRAGPPPAPPPTPWVAITGGKGGVGKTLLAVNAAVLLAGTGRRILLADLDPGLGDVHVHLRMAPQHALEDVLDGTCSPRRATLAVRDGLYLLTGRSGSPALAGGDRDYLERAIAAVDAAAVAVGADLVVCDTGAGIGPSVLAVGRRATLTLAVTTPDPAAVTDAYALLKLFDREQITTPQLVVNRVRRRDDAMRTTARLTEVCRRFLGHGVQSLGWLHDDRALESSIRDQRPFVDGSTDRHQPAHEDLRALAAAIAGRLPNRRRAGTDVATAHDTAQAMQRLAGPR